MKIAYVDESGDTGDPQKSGASTCFVLGCIVLDAADWPMSFDHLVDFRRNIRDNFGPLMRQELKANFLTRNGGGLRRFGLSPAQRRLIYNYHLNQLQAMSAKAFSVVVDKASAGVSGYPCLEMAWVTLLQRLERTYRADDGVMVVHDNGDNVAVRRILRKARRHMVAGSHYGGSTFSVPLRLLIEDPSPRPSHESYFLQLADLVAYAGWRTYIPPGRGVALVVDQRTWQELGPAVLSVVNSVARRGEPGVVIRY